VEGVHFLLAFICGGDSWGLLKRHREKRGQGFVCRDCERDGLIEKKFAEAKAEENAGRRFHPGGGFPIPKNLQDDLLQMELFGRGYGDPDMTNDAWSGNIEKVESRAWRDGARIGIATGAIIT